MNKELYDLKMKIGGLKEVIITSVKLASIGQCDFEEIKRLGSELDKVQDRLTRLLRSDKDLK